jgi:hypothetical protein
MGSSIYGFVVIDGFVVYGSLIADAYNRYPGV